MTAAPNSPPVKDAEQLYHEWLTDGGQESVRSLARRCFEAGKASNPQWRPIETAPRDGFHVLLYRPDICFVGYFAAVGDWVISAPGLPLMVPPPTHWMPLPEHPTR
jgi:hypothetical protein